MEKNIWLKVFSDAKETLFRNIISLQEKNLATVDDICC